MPPRNLLLQKMEKTMTDKQVFEQLLDELLLELSRGVSNPAGHYEQVLRMHNLYYKMQEEGEEDETE